MLTVSLQALTCTSYSECTYLTQMCPFLRVRKKKYSNFQMFEKNVWFCGIYCVELV